MRLNIIILLALTTTSHLIEAATIRQGSIDRGSLGNSWRLNEHKVDRLNRPRLEDESLVIRDEYSLLQKVLPTSNANATNEYADGRIYNRQRRVDDERQEEYNTLEQSIEPPSTPNKTKWIAHGTISILCFGLLIPTSISSALFRHLFPTYWIYIHVIIRPFAALEAKSESCEKIKPPESREAIIFFARLSLCSRSGFFFLHIEAKTKLGPQHVATIPSL